MYPSRNGPGHLLIMAKIQSRKMVSFTQQLAAMIDASIPIVKSLGALEKQEDNPDLKKFIHEVRLDIETGSSLSVAFGKHKTIISPFFVSMLSASEHGANLIEVLKKVASHLENEQKLREKLKSVFRYPIMVGSFCGVLTLFLLLVVAPIFAKVYSQLGVTLPLPTVILLGSSEVIQKFWWVVVFGGGGAYFGLKKLKPDTIKKARHAVISNLPILGTMLTKVATAQFIRSFSNMITCHVSLLEALEVVDKVVNNLTVSRMIHHARQSIQQGGTLTQAFEASGMFSPVVIQMASVGEQSGNLGPLLEKCADALEAEVDDFSKKAVMVLEPTLTLMIAIVVGFIALAIYMPMFDLMGHVK